MKYVAAIGVLAACWVGNAATDEDVTSCSRLESSLERLDCYDRVARRIAQQPAGTTRSNARPTYQTRARADSPTREATTAAAMPDSSGTLKPAREEDRPGLLRRLFGAEAIKNERRRKTEKLDSINGEVASVAQLSRGTYQVTLEDGQIWRENEVERRTTYEVGDQVVISRALMGSYNLKNLRTGHLAKVHRIE